MPNIRSAKKEVRKNERQRLVNDRRRRAMRKEVKTIEALIQDGKGQDAQSHLATAYKAIDKAAKGGIIKNNTASRKKSRLSAAIARAKA